MVLVMTPVLELYEIPAPPESEEEEILLLKTLQSVLESSPRLSVEAVGRLKIVCWPALVMVKSVPLVLVAKVTAPDDVVA